MGSVTEIRRKTTYTDMLQWPDDGRRYELYDGEVWEMPAPTLAHQDTTLRAAGLLRDYAARTGGLAAVSPLDIVFSELDVLQPDVVYFDAALRDRLAWREAIRIPPTLVVEVMSPSTARNDRIRKLAIFAKYGVPEYWMLDPDRCRMEILRLQGDGRYAVVQAGGCGAVLASPQLPDLSCPVSRLFYECETGKTEV